MGEKVSITQYYKKNYIKNRDKFFKNHNNFQFAFLIKWADQTKEKLIKNYKSQLPSLFKNKPIPHKAERFYTTTCLYQRP